MAVLEQAISAGLHAFQLAVARSVNKSGYPKIGSNLDQLHLERYLRRGSFQDLNDSITLELVALEQITE